MAICKYFLQGSCRFGANCRNEHYAGQSPISRAPQTTAAFNDKVDTANLIRSISNDMLVAEKGNQWVLSCYSPFKEKPNFPDFKDYSFEEIRLQCYEAQKNGTLEQFKVNFNKIVLESMQKVKALQNPTGELINVIRKVYFTTSPEEHVSSNVFGTKENQNTNYPVSNSPFGGTATNTNSIFGAKPTFAQRPGFNPQQPSIFGGPQSGSASIFGQNPAPPVQSGTIFGAPAAPSTQQNAFAQNQGIFGPKNASPVQPNIQPFAQQPIVQNQQSIFSQQPNAFTQQKSIFGAVAPNATPFVNSSGTNQNPIFGASTPSPPQNVFGNSTPLAAQGNIFGNSTPAAQTNIFGNVAPLAQNPIFSNTTNVAQNSIFARPSTAVQGSIFAAPSSQPKNIFANSQANDANTIAFGANNFTAQDNQESIFRTGKSNEAVVTNNTTVYSKRNDLSDGEMKAFESEYFTFGKIPEHPPLLEMC